MTISKEKVFSVIRCGLALETLDFQLSETEINELSELGRKQSVLPIIYNGLSRMTIPKEQIKVIERARNKDLYRFLQLDECIRIKVGLVKIGEQIFMSKLIQ